MADSRDMSVPDGGASAGAKAAASSAEPLTIVVIDDDRISRELMASTVEALGYRAVTTASGLEGLRIIHEIRPSLVLLDVVMPGFDGYKIAAAIKAQPRFVPVILLTALNDHESKRRGQAAGADDFLSKPVARLDLEVRIAAMLRIKSLTDALDDANRRLAELATTDVLTQIPNRRFVEDALRSECERARRYRRSLAVYLLDIDFFKRINDTHGHGVGDVVLKQVAQTVARTLRQTDRVGRWGGEEFCVVAPEVDARATATLGERLRRAVELHAPTAGVNPTVSVGGAIYTGEGVCEPAELVARADAALYRAKHAGRNRVELDGAVRGG